VAVVSDSFNIFEACSDIWGTQLKDGICGFNGLQPEELLIIGALAHLKGAECDSGSVHMIGGNEFHYYQDGMLLLCFAREGIYNNKNILLGK
jgi:hypothetical protein